MAWLNRSSLIYGMGHRSMGAGALCCGSSRLVGSFVAESWGRPFWEGLQIFKTLFHLGHTPSTAGTFRKRFRKNSGKTPETLSERFLEFPSRVWLGCPKPYNLRHLRLPEHFQNSLPPVQLGTPLFQKWFRRGPLRAGHGIPSSTEGISDHCKASCPRSSKNTCQTIFLVLWPPFPGQNLSDSSFPISCSIENVW